MQKTDYDALLRHSEMLKDLLKNLEKQYEFGSVTELEKVRSIIQQVKAASSETNDAIARIDAKRKNVEKVRKYVNRITVVLAFLTVILVAFFGIYRMDRAFS